MQGPAIHAPSHHPGPSVGTEGVWAGPGVPRPAGSGSSAPCAGSLASGAVFHLQCTWGYQCQALLSQAELSSVACIYPLWSADQCAEGHKGSQGTRAVEALGWPLI